MGLLFRTGISKKTWKTEQSNFFSVVLNRKQLKIFKSIHTRASW